MLCFFFCGALFDLSEHHDSSLLPLAEQREKVVIEGTVLRPVKIMPDMASLEFRSERVFIRGEIRAVREKVLVIIYNYSQEYSPGDKIRCPARLRPFKNFNNPGRYDYETAMSLRGFSCAASVSDGRRIVPMGMGRLGLLIEIIEKARRPVREFSREILSPQSHALFRALILGERHAISPEMRETFNRAGLGHILAVSGLHIGLVAWLSFFISKWLLSLSYRMTLQIDIRKAAAIITCIPIISYTCLAGFQVSSQRAMIMALTYLFSIILGREKDIWSTLALAALIVLAVDPHAIFSISFQLSFGAVIGILWLAPAIHERILARHGDDGRQKTIINRLYFSISGSIAVTTSAVIFLLPLTTFYFHRISLVSIPANLTVVPILGFWVIPFGLLSSICLPLFAGLANLFLQAGAMGIEFMMKIIEFWASFSWSASWIITPNIFEIILFYGALFFFFFMKRWSWAKTVFFIVLILIVSDCIYWTWKTQFNKHLKVTYLDVGQGNSALVQFPGRRRMLIDGGGFPQDRFDVGKMVVAPFLWHSKIKRIDCLVLSHPQADHMNGLHFIADNFHCKEFWFNGDRGKSRSYRKLMKLIDSKKIKKLLPGDLRHEREYSGVKIEVLHPQAGNNETRGSKKQLGLNDNSLVVKFTYAGRSFLFTGDIEIPGEHMVVSNAGSLLKSDVLLAPHHGSKTSCSKPFLDMVRPGICVISSGSGNYWGFPHLSTLKKLKAIGCRVIRIDQAGAVRLTAGEGKIQIRCFNNGDCE